MSVTDWYFAAASHVVSEGLLETTEDGRFAPAQPMTRAMLVKALYRLAGAPAVTASPLFTDVPVEADYAQAVAWAYEAGVAGGKTATTFDPDGSVTREQLAAMLYRYVQRDGGTAGKGSLSGFSDAKSVSLWAVDAVGWAVENKLISGIKDGTILPRGTATRAQAAQILTRFEGIAAS